MREVGVDTSERCCKLGPGRTGTIVVPKPVAYCASRIPHPASRIPNPVSRTPLPFRPVRNSEFGSPRLALP